MALAALRAAGSQDIVPRLPPAVLAASKGLQAELVLLLHVVVHWLGCRLRNVAFALALALHPLPAMRDCLPRRSVLAPRFHLLAIRH
eukprot:2328128-Alexandrium_andersonii.AAC.1